MFIYTELWKLGVMFLVDEVSKERLKMGGYSNSRPLPDTTYSAIVVILSKLLSYLDNDPQNNTARVSAASLNAQLNFVKLNLCCKNSICHSGDTNTRCSTIPEGLCKCQSKSADQEFSAISFYILLCFDSSPSSLVID